MEHQSGSTRIKLGTAWKNALSISAGKAAEILELEEGESIQAISFARIIKNFVFHTESNLYVTNKRVAIQEGTWLTTIWGDDIVSVTLQESTLWETIYMMSKYSYVTIVYHAKEGDKTLKFWCSNGVIGSAPTPENDKTKEIFTFVEATRIA